MKIGILQADSVPPEFAGEFGEYPDMFIALLSKEAPETEFAVYDVVRGEYPAALDEADAYLITGSKAGVYEDAPWIRQLREFVVRLHEARKKLVGICFGHQMVAHALGGRAEKSDRGWGVGAHPARFAERPPWFDEGPLEFHLLVSHQDQVTEPAAGAKVLAGSDFCPAAVCMLGAHILTFQAHPEFLPGYSECLMNLRREHIGEPRYREGIASLSTPLDQPRAARWILNFLRS